MDEDEQKSRRDDDEDPSCWQEEVDDDMPLKRAHSPSEDLMPHKRRLYFDDEASEEPVTTTQRLASFSMVSPEKAGETPKPNPSVVVDKSNRNASREDDARRSETLQNSKQRPNDRDLHATEQEEDDFNLSDFLSANNMDPIEKDGKDTLSKQVYVRNSNKAFVGYEYLTGRIVLFTAWTNNDSDPRNIHAYIFHAVFGCNARDYAPFHDHTCKGVRLSAGTNTEEPLEAGGYNSYGILLLTRQGHTVRDTKQFLGDFVRFLNTHTYVKKRGSTPNHLVARHGRTEYVPMTNPDLSRAPRRCLGETVVLSEAINFLKYDVNPSAFDENAYEKNPALINKLFPPPHNETLCRDLGCPIPSK